MLDKTLEHAAAATLPSTPRRRRGALGLLGAALPALLGCGAARPNYTVTSNMYAEAPKRVVVLPFAPEPGKSGRIDVTAKSAVACRDTFYRHFSVERFEDVELSDVDAAVNGRPTPAGRQMGMAERLAKQVDVVGLTSLLSLHEILWESPWEAPEGRAETKKLLERFHPDAYAIGATRAYGWFYGVLFSAVTVGCKMEIRSCKTGALLWKGEWTQRSFAHALDTSIWIIPYRLVQVWQNTRGKVLESVTDRTFREMARTIPYVREPVKAFVKPARYRIRLYEKDDAKWWRRLAKVRRKGLRMPMITHGKGWYKCVHPTYGECWVRDKDGILVDEEDRTLERADR